MDLNYIVSPELRFALGWTLIHSFWQVLFVSVILLVFLQVTKHFSSAFRYIIVLIGLFFCPLISFITFINYYHQARHLEISRLLQELFSPSIDLAPITGFNSSFLDYQSWASVLWFSGVIFIGLKEAILYHRFKNKLSANMAGHGEMALTQKLEEAFVGARKKLHIPFHITLHQTSLSVSPLTIGVIKKSIFIPASLLAGISSEQLELILLHELAHIKRRDSLFSSLQSLIKTLYFFNPFIYLISHQLDQEREMACDQMVIEVTNARSTYAKTLLMVAEHQQRPEFGLSLFGNKSKIFSRITSIYAERKKTHYSTKLTSVLLLSTTLGVATVAAGIANGASDDDTMLIKQMMDSPLVKDLPVNQRPQAISYILEEFRQNNFSRNKANEELLELENGTIKIVTFGNSQKVLIDINPAALLLLSSDKSQQKITQTTIFTTYQNGFIFGIARKQKLSDESRVGKLISDYENTYTATHSEAKNHIDQNIDLEFRISQNYIMVWISSKLIDLAIKQKETGNMDLKSYAKARLVSGTIYEGAHKSEEGNMVISFDNLARLKKLVWLKRLDPLKNPVVESNIDYEKCTNCENHSQTCQGISIPSELSSFQLTEKQLAKIDACIGKHRGLIDFHQESTEVICGWNKTLMNTGKLNEVTRANLIDRQKHFSLGYSTSEKGNSVDNNLNADDYWINIYDDADFSLNDPLGLLHCK